MKKRFFISTICATLINLFILLFTIISIIPEDLILNKDIIKLFFSSTQNIIYVILSVLTCVGASFFIYSSIVNPIKQWQKEILKAERDYKKAEKMRSEFVANVTHELRTPLTSISGFIETLKEGADENPEVRKKFLDIIEIETARLKRLIEDILVLSDIENRRENKDEELIDTKEELQKIVETIRHNAEKKGIKIITELEEKCYVKCSVDRFIQMFMNLIENAIKYSKDSCNQNIRITSKKYEDCVKISVSDNGIGISEKHMARLFERFYRVDKSRTKKGGGTGLGLSIVKHIAISFGAEVQVESKVDVGSTFTIIFKK